MERMGFLYKKDRNTIRTAWPEQIPGCFYYECDMEQESIYLPDGRIHYVWKYDHLEEYHYIEKAIRYAPESNVILGIAIEPSYICTTDVRQITEFFERLSEQETFAQRRNYYERNGFLALYPKKGNPLIETVWNSMMQTEGKASVEQLATGAQYTARQIEKVFKQQFGYGPKRLEQFFRLHETVARMQEDASVPLSQIAWELGYSDPSHMQREFKRFTGMTPNLLRQHYVSEESV